MRYSLKEGVLFGVIIGAAVLLIRAFVGGALLPQLLLLALVAIVLVIAQVLLGLRHVRPQNQQPSMTPAQPERPRTQRHAQSQDPFAREKNQAWTGLSSTPVQDRNDAGHASPETSFPESPQRASEAPREAPPANHHQS
jgi:hypothetical protein